MRKLEGVFDVGIADSDDLKRYSLLFDGLHAVVHGDADEKPIIRSEQDFQYLHDQGFLNGIDLSHLLMLGMQVIRRDKAGRVRAFAKEEFSKLPADSFEPEELTYDPYLPTLLATRIHDLRPEVDVVPVHQGSAYNPVGSESSQESAVIKIAMEHFPLPGPSSAWEDIWDFKAEMLDKQWHFRRFISSLATKKQSESEIRDDIEWSLNEYSKAMNIHRLKSSQSFLDVYVVAPLEIIEDLVKFNWSKVAKGLLQVQKRKVDLLEAETKAPGRECAYVFNAQHKWGDRG